MSLQHTTSIVTDGLIFYYDSLNSKKSWKGKPTTNFVPNADTMSGWSIYGNGTPVQFLTEFGTYGYRMDYLGSWNGVYRSISLPSAGTYTFSAWIKWIGGSSNVTGGGVYISSWGGSDSASVTNRTLPGKWQRISLTLNCTNTYVGFYLINWGGTNNADNSSWQVTMPQIEAESYATPFISGTRSTSQALLDLTGNNTITVNNLTYNSDGTFVWSSGVNSSVTSTVSALAFGARDFTIECWIRPTNFMSYTHMVAIPDQSVFALKGNTGTGEIYFYSPGFTTYGTITNWTLTANAWNHVVFIRRGSVAYGFLNGVLSGSKSGFTNNFTSTSLSIGNGYLNEYTSKQISKVSIYNRGLSSSEVLQNFNAQRSRYGL